MFLLTNARLCFGQYTLKTYANHDVVERKVISTEHFKIVYPSSDDTFATKVAHVAEEVYKAYVQLLGFNSSEKIALYISPGRMLISETRALNKSSLVPLWQKNTFFSCFNGNLPEWKYILRFEIANALLAKIHSSKLGLFQAFLLSSPSVPLWSSGIPAYLSVPYLTKCDVRFLSNFWNVEKRAQKEISYLANYSETMLGRSQIHFFSQIFPTDLLQGLYDTHKSFLGIKYYDFKYAFIKTFGVPYSFFFNQWKTKQFKSYNKNDSLPKVNYSFADTAESPKDGNAFNVHWSNSKPYHSFFNIDVEFPIILPYYLGTDDWGLGILAEWQSPLQLHKFRFAGILSVPSVVDQSFFYTTYTNNRFGPRIKLAFKHYTSASDWLDLTVEQSSIAALSLLSRINAWSTEYSVWYMGFMLRQMHINYFSPSSANRDAANIVFDNKHTSQTDLRLVLAWRKLLPTKYNSIHPLNGHGFRLSVTGSGPLLNEQTQYARFYSEAFMLIPTVGKQRIYLYASGAFDIDDPIGADYLYLSDDGDYELPEPKLMGSIGRAVEGFVRGYDRSIAGESFAMATLEYRIPLVLSSSKLFGVFPLPKMALGLFMDGGVIGQARSLKRTGFTAYRYSLGAELKTALSFEDYSIVFNVGVAQALDQPFGPMLYFNIAPAIPF